MEEPAGGLTVSGGHEAGHADDVYGIDYVGFCCDEETTYDAFSSSDEVSAVTSVVSIDPDGFNADPRVALSGTITDGINWLLDTDDDQIDIARTVILDRARMEEIGRRPLVPYDDDAGKQTTLVTFEPEVVIV